MTQHYLCFHSTRTQPFTRESCITHPSCSLPPSRRLVVFYLLLFHFNLFLRHLTVPSTQFRVLPPSLSRYSYPLSSSLMPAPSISTYTTTAHELFPYCGYLSPFNDSFSSTLSRSSVGQRHPASTHHLNFLYILYDLSHVYSECILAIFFFIPNRIERIEGIRTLS